MERDPRKDPRAGDVLELCGRRYISSNDAPWCGYIVADNWGREQWWSVTLEEWRAKFATATVLWVAP